MHTHTHTRTRALGKALRGLERISARAIELQLGVVESDQCRPVAAVVSAMHADLRKSNKEARDTHKRLGQQSDLMVMQVMPRARQSSYRRSSIAVLTALVHSSRIA
jgi:hypothetical protein